MKEKNEKEISNTKEILYFAFKNKKLIIGICLFLFFLLLGVFGPYLTQYGPMDYAGPGYHPPNSEYWLGTTFFGQDVFSQLVYGLRSSFGVGLLGGSIATLIGLSVGFFAGYKGGAADEILMMMTNVMMVIPTIALMIVFAAYLPYRGVAIQAIIIGCTAWPWTARAVRSQTFSLKQRNFVSLARITGVKTIKIISGEIAPNMLSYVFMVYILQFGGSILAAVTLDFIGLGPTMGISLGLMLENAVLWNAIQLGMWWWIIPPGLAITLIVGGLYFMNTGLDEIFNPKLREM
jgi:peptide/nickel transport system permease protein